MPDYFYSDSIKAHVVWDQETLRAFILSPRTYIKYNRMGFSGIQDETAVEDLVTYLIEAAKPPVE